MVGAVSGAPVKERTPGRGTLSRGPWSSAGAYPNRGPPERQTRPRTVRTGDGHPVHRPIVSPIVGIEFVGYSGDCRIFGRVPSLGERLTDLLNGGQRVIVRDARLESLDDGHIVTAPLAEVERDELYAVVAHGPRGARTQRVRTAKHRIRVDLGPYVVLGNLHSPPDADPVGDVLRRDVMVPLTNATIAYALNGRAEAEDVGTIIINRTLAEWIAPIDEVARAGASRMPRKIQIKDFTDLRTG